MFAAIACNIGHHDQTAARLRLLTIEEMKNNSERYLPHFVPNGSVLIAKGFEVNYTDWESYLRLVSRSQTWVDNIELQALSHVLRMAIVVLRAGEVVPHSDPIIGREYFMDQNPLYVGYVNNNHYIPLALPQGRDHDDLRSILLKRF